MKLGYYVEIGRAMKIPSGSFLLARAFLGFFAWNRVFFTSTGANQTLIVVNGLFAEE
jgi:hypothetical protein